MASHQSLYDRNQDITLEEIKKTLTLYSEKDRIINTIHRQLLDKISIPSDLPDTEYNRKLKEIKRMYSVRLNELLNRQNNPHWNSFCEANEKIRNISQQYRDSLKELIRITSLPTGP